MEKSDLEDQVIYQKRWFSFLMNKNVPDITEKRPYDDSGIFNKLTYGFVFKTLRIGYKRTLQSDDLLYLPDDMKVDQLYATFTENLSKRAKRDISTLSVILALLNTFKYQYIYSVFAIGICDAGNCLLPLLSRQLIRFVQEKAYGLNPYMGDGVGYALGCSIAIYVCFLLGNHFLYFANITAVEVKAVLSKLLIEKAFKADAKSKHEYSIAKLTTFMATDLAKIDFGIQHAPILLSFPTTLTTAVVILAIYIGAPAAVGIGIVLAFAFVLVGLTTLMVKVRVNSLVFTDKRVNYIKEVVNNLKIIKFYSWEEPYYDNISKTRTLETKQLYKLQFIRNNLIAIAICLSSFSSMASFLVLFETDSNGKDPAVVFSSLSLFGLLGYFIITIPLAAGTSADAVISLGRITGFLRSGEDNDSDNINYIEFDEKKPALKAKNATFFWNSFEDVEVEDENKKKKKKKAGEPAKTETRISESFLLKDLNFEIQRGEFIIVTGVIGSGKSSLLRALAGFMARKSGDVDVNGSILLCAENWIQNETLRNNIVFGEEFDERKYLNVVDVCGLEDDFDLLPAGDATEIGERGITLSGGQKARVNLARATYNGTDIILLDDVLSAVDARVGKHIMDNCILGLLKDKTRILATHQLSYINAADRVMFLNGDGTVLVGTVDELSETNESFTELLSYNYKDQTTTEVKPEEIEEEVEMVLEDNGKHTGEEETTVELKPYQSRDHDATGRLIQDERKAVNTIGWDIYKTYFKLGSKPWHPLVLLFFIIASVSLSTFCQIFTNVWLSFWTEDKFGVSEGVYEGLFIIFTFLGFLFLLVQFWCFIHFTNLAARNLNIKSVKNLLNAPMSYLDTTPIGRIMNRFTKDTDSLDNEIIEQFRLISHALGFMIGVIIMCIIYLPWFAIAVPFLLFIFLFVGSYYQASSREIKRLEAVKRSLVYNNFNEALTGMDVIKAFGKVHNFVDKNDRCVDNMNEASFLINGVQRWLAMQLNGVSFIFVTTITLLSVGRVFNISPASVGLIVAYLLSMPNMLTLIIQSYTNLENEMNAVERMCEFAFDTPQEKAYHISETAPPPQWPDKGRIEFNNVSMCYRPGLPRSLKNISCVINPNERIGICGRTGAGKSSLVSTLFRLTELVEGTVNIDGIDISQLGLNELRSKLSIIPQESVLFKGTIRSNLDPFQQKSDDELWNILIQTGCVTSEEVEKFKNDEKVADGHKFHLQSVVENEGTNFSLGERQLIAFARALVKNSKILLLDEATSSVDYQTDAKIQKLIVDNFSHCTILCIAHRLQTILNYDRIIVLDHGKIEEFDTPINLFNKEDSIFRSLCDKAKINSNDLNHN